MIRAIAVGAMLSLLPASVLAETDARLGARGAELLKPFKQSLMGALKEGLQKGPDVAVGICHQVAPELPTEMAPEGVRMGRTSHRLRNPDNAPTPWQRELIRHYLEQEDRTPQVRHLDDGRVAYAEPIQVQPTCLMCHGKPEQIPSPVKAKLDALYPQDQAIGFSEGDFRGIFWVTWEESDGGH